MTKMLYNSSATQEVKPTIIKMVIGIDVHDNEVASAVKTLSNIRKSCRDLIYSKKSCNLSTYKQTEITVSEQFEYNQIERPRNGQTVTQTIKVKNGYNAATALTFTLLNEDTVVEDFTNIINIPLTINTDNIKVKCQYDFDITKEERANIMCDLTAQAIDNGLADIEKIIETSNTLKGKSATIESIDFVESQPSYGGGVPKYKESSFCGDIFNQEDIDEIITPELVQDIFDNRKIILNKRMTLCFDIK